MPHEKINHPDASGQQAVVGWNKIGWVQLSIFPEGWSDTGDAARVDMSVEDIDKLIHTLKRAKRQAYTQGTDNLPGESWRDREAMPEGSDLFNR